jgi:hypothetical protein
MRPRRFSISLVKSSVYRTINYFRCLLIAASAASAAILFAATFYCTEISPAILTSAGITEFAVIFFLPLLNQPFVSFFCVYLKWYLSNNLC